MKIEKNKTLPIESNKTNRDALNKKIQEIMRVLKKEIITNYSDKKSLK